MVSKHEVVRERSQDALFPCVRPFIRFDPTLDSSDPVICVSRRSRSTRVFRGARALERERERDRTRCRWEETALTLERGSVRTEARARSFAYLLPTLPEYVQLSSVPFNLPANAASHDRSTRRKPLSHSLVRKEKVERKEEKKERNDARFRYEHNIAAEERGGPRGSRCYFSTVTDRTDGWPSPSISREKEKRPASNLRPMETRISCSITEEDPCRR